MSRHSARSRAARHGRAGSRARTAAAPRRAAAGTRRPAGGGHGAASLDEHLHPRDRGRVRAYVRDLVDGRRNLLGLFMPTFAVALIATVNRPSDIRTWSLVLSLPLLALMAVEAVALGVWVTRKARAAFPDVQVGALRTGWYAFMRAHRPRRVRLPAPRVTR